jgi:hypothetical protein
MMVLFGFLFGFRAVTAQGKPEAASVNTGEVMNAYYLRMNGKVDQAKSLLEDILKKDSTNAMAYYELARLQSYMLIGRGKVTMEDILISMNKAVTNNPKNEIYAYYRAITCFLNAFISMQQGQEQVKPKIDETCKAFEKVLELDPGYYEAMLYLVDIKGMLPKDMGGDSAKAIEYTGKLEKLDNYFGAKARADLLPENSDMVKYWESLLMSNKKNPEYLMEIGRSYLYRDDPTNAELYFNEARKSDPSKNILILDLARYHIYKVMGNKELTTTELPLSKTYIEQYLKSIPEPIIPLKAYSMGLIALTDNFLGNQAEADKRMGEENLLDPYYSKSSGIPTLMLFEPPDKVCHNYFSFFRPF